MDKKANCVEDLDATGVRGPREIDRRSPKQLLTTTIGDEMKLANNKNSKVVGISIKDRGAIIPAGHMADGAYWYDKRTGKFVTSSYYMEQDRKSTRLNSSHVAISYAVF